MVGVISLVLICWLMKLNSFCIVLLKFLILVIGLVLLWYLCSIGLMFSVLFSVVFSRFMLWLFLWCVWVCM